jgi:pentatricopeptide repeat protein
MKHNQPAAAERVIQMMERQGMQPNLVTWNTLVSGYAALQEVNKVIDVTDKMKERGFDGDERTLEGLGRVINREKLLAALQGHEEEEEPSSEENPSSISDSL